MADNLAELEDKASRVMDIDPENEEWLDEDSNEPEIGRSLLPLRSVLSRYVRIVKTDPQGAARRGWLPSHAAVNVLKLARQGNPKAQTKIKAVMKLAESDFPDASKAQQARENLFRAAALEDAGVPMEDAYFDDEEMSESLDDEIGAFEACGEQVGLGLVPLLGGALAALIAWMFIKPSAALAQVNQPKMPISPEAAAKNLSPASYEGKKVKDVPQAVLNEMMASVAYVFNRINPATKLDTPWDQLSKLQLVLAVPASARDPQGKIFVRRAAKERLAANVAAQATFKDPEQTIVLAPVIIQPAYGPLGFKLPVWAENIIKRAASASTGIPVP